MAATARRSGITEYDLPPSTWSVLLAPGTPPIQITAAFCVVSTGGVLSFRDRDGNSIFALQPGQWAVFQMQEDGYGNPDLLKHWA